MHILIQPAGASVYCCRPPQLAICIMESPATILTSASTAQTNLYSIMLRTKRKRRPAGTPDPDADVIALSPHTLMESDSYVCEICNQGFQRDQNLQMHRRRHKVPWKLLKRVEPEVRKRVYVCPEPSCLHHDPCHALGDMVGIKKHYRRKHSSMKQWQCDRCSKAYAVQSDYKAHLKTCGTRGHCCDCGRVFSRIESFIEHQDTCTAPRRNKNQNASNEFEAGSLHAPDGEIRSGIVLPPLHVQISASPASPVPALTTQALDACIANDPAEATTRPPLSPASPALLCQRSLRRHIALSAHSTEDQNIWWQGQQPCMNLHKSANLQHVRVSELELLPTLKAPLSQAESPQGFLAGGKEIKPNSSETTAAKPAYECMREGVDYLEMLPLSGKASMDAAAPAVCNLQLSIGMSNSGQFTANNGKSICLHVATSKANQEGLPLNINDACFDVVPTIEVVKKHSSRTVFILPDIGHADPLQTEQSDGSSSGSVKNPDSVQAKLLFERASCKSHTLNFLLNPDDLTEPAAEAAEVLLQEAREKLRRASAEKLEAENAWREARREREKAEQELAKAQRIAEYNAGRVVRAEKLGADHLQLALMRKENGGAAGTRKSNCCSSTSSSPCSSNIANSQAATSSLQIRQVHGGGTTSITCPTCLHTQIFYPSPARTSMGTLFL